MRRDDETRIAETEALFREVNERIVTTAAELESDSAEVVCECADDSCVQRVETAIEDYERVRADGAHFVVAPGHEDERVERIVHRRPGYRVVEKLGRVGVLARRLAPSRE